LQSKIAAEKGSVPGLFVTPNQRGGQLKSIGGTQFVPIETSFGKVTRGR
jgi:hypothetical protein